MPQTRAILLLAATLALFGAAFPVRADSEVNIYSYRQPSLIKPVLDAFTRQTGIITNVLFLDKGLVERMKIEGENSPADVLLTIDITRLTELKESGVTQPLADPGLDRAIPAAFRDPDGHWFGLTARARVLYASNDRVAQKDITYEELADPQWKGRLCMRDGRHASNITLFASMIAHHGMDYTEKWLTGLRRNLVSRPNGSDRSQGKAIFTGECDLALGDAYFAGLMLTDTREPEQQAWAGSLHVIFPNARDRGTSVNISGMALAKYAPNKDNAVTLMDFLASRQAQELYAAEALEYPLLAGAEPSGAIKAFGPMKPDLLPLSEIARHRKLAEELIDKIDFNDGPSE